MRKFTHSKIKLYIKKPDTKYKRKALAVHAVVEYRYEFMTYFDYIRLVLGLEQQMTK